VTVDAGAPQLAFERIAGLLEQGGALVLSGAGISTESGIPDYRGPTGAARRSHTPMTFQTFVGDPLARRRYWARSFLGWRAMTGTRPNDGHRAVAALQRAGAIGAIITQNVDGLHQQAGARDVIELHGTLSRTVCLHCGSYAARADLDRRLRELNPSFVAHATRINPDGDADLPDEDLADFRMAPCEACGRPELKPDVVFFGETVPRPRVDACFARVDAAQSLLVLGSSMAVMSGYRLVLAAAQRAIPIGIINQGPSRADAKATARLDAPLGAALRELAAEVDLADVS